VLSDAIGNSWTQVGTVPQVPTFGNRPPGAGPMSTSNYYRLGTGADVLDFAGDFTAVMVFDLASRSTSQTLIDSSTYGSKGYRLVLSSGSVKLYTWDGAGGVLSSDDWLPPNDGDVVVVAFGREGTSYQYLSVSGLVDRTTNAKVLVDATKGTYVGVVSDGSGPLLGKLREAWFTSATPTIAGMSTITREIYRKLGTQIVSILGDSNTLNYAPRVPAVTIGGRHYTNNGVSGDTTTQILARWPAIRALRPTHVVLMGGTNDRALSAATAIQNLKIIVEDARARGIRVVWLTIPPFYGVSGWTSAQETVRTTINAAILAYTSTPGVKVINTDVFGNGATPPALSSACDFGDHLHLSVACQISLATLVGAALQ
jgi:hypothetical protein